MKQSTSGRLHFYNTITQEVIVKKGLGIKYLSSEN